MDTISNDQVVYLNHDAGFDPVYINKSIEQLGICLAIYHSFIISLVDFNDPAYNRRKFTPEEFKALADDMAAIDTTCFDTVSFWAYEMAGMLWENEHG